MARRALVAGPVDGRGVAGEVRAHLRAHDVERESKREPRFGRRFGFFDVEHSLWWGRNGALAALRRQPEVL